MSAEPAVTEVSAGIAHALRRGLLALAPLLACTPIAAAAQAPDETLARQRIESVNRKLTASALAEATGLSPRDHALAVPAAALKRPGNHAVALPAGDRQVLAQSLREVLHENSLSVFPSVVHQVAPDGSGRNLMPHVLVGEPLKYSAFSDRFEGSIKIGVTDLDAPAGAAVLAYPLTFQVLESGLADPAETVIRSTAPPHATVAIRTADVSQPVVVRVASSLAPAGTAVTLPVLPTLRLHADRTRIQGFGLETTRLHVSTVALPEPQGRRVVLSTDGSASIEPSAVSLDEAGIATALLRSNGSGPLVVTASLAGLGKASREVDIQFPWRTLFAATIGGVLGGLIRVGTGWRRGQSYLRALGALALAVLIGLLVFALAAVGVKLLPVTFAVTVGEVYVLAVAALGAWLGTRVLAPLARG